MEGTQILYLDISEAYNSAMNRLFSKVPKRVMCFVFADDDIFTCGKRVPTRKRIEKAVNTIAH